MPSKLSLYLQHLNVGVSVYAPDVLLPFWLSANAYLGRQETTIQQRRPLQFPVHYIPGPRRQS